MRSQERKERARIIQDGTKCTFDMILAQEMGIEEGRAAADHLQRMVDLRDLSDSLDCRNIAKGR